MAFAPAKINLFLHVTGKTANGYHLLESLMAPLAFGDALEATQATEFALDIVGDASLAALPAEQNLVLKAARLLQQSLGTKKAAHLTLQKHIPHAAGLGGGSSDAATALLLLQQVWQQKIAPEACAELALKLGADVPFFLKQTACYAEGVGEILTPIQLPKLHLLLVKPAQGVSTADIFNMGFTHFSDPIKKQPGFTSQQEVVAMLTPLKNDLTHNALKLCPVIGDILTRLEAQPGCELARMSGSGSACFGIFADARSCVQAANTFSDHWAKATHTL